MTKRSIIYFILISSFIIQSCAPSLRLAADKKLFGGTSFKIFEKNKEGKIDHIEEKLDALIYPKPNTMLGIGKYKSPFKVMMYYKLEADKKQKGKGANSFIEKPVYFKENQLKKNEQILKDFLQSKGYFDVRVDGSAQQNKKIVFTKYYIDLGQRYKIDTVELDCKREFGFEKDLYEALSLTKFDAYFDLENIKIQRLLVEENLRNKGYYNFRPDYIEIKADSINREKSFKLILSPKASIDQNPIIKKQYQINDIFVNIDQKPILNTDEESDLFRGLILEDPAKKFKPKIFFDAIAFRPGTLFDSRLQNISNNRLIGLGNFKLINSSFQVVNRLDSTFLDAYYYFQTQKPKSFRAEANAISRSSGLAGSQLSINWQNINTFRGGEQFKISAKGGLELQLGGKTTNVEFRDNYRIGLDAQLNFPRFIAPWIKIDPEISKVLPKTQVLIGWQTFIKSGLYNLNTVQAALGYSWTRGRGVEHTLKPINLNFVKSTKLTTAFTDEIFSNPSLLSILDNQLIIGGSYEINVLPIQRGNTSFSYRGGIDLAGNLLGLLDLTKSNPAKKGQIFGESFSQFLKIENDIRYKYDINRKLTLANRAFIGIGQPYGNSLQLPFVNQFYVGGNNSLRAFRARGVGPGTHQKTNSAAELFLGNNTGDIKLELNTELRYKINGFFGTAVFVDAGNVWLAKDQFIYGKDALFNKNFLSEMAIGTGMGLRLDFSFVIFRIDVGTPIKKPWLEKGSRIVLNQINFSQKTWRQENLVFNIAVGMPF